MRGIRLEPAGRGREPEKSRAEETQGQDRMMSQVKDLQEAETDREQRRRLDQGPGKIATAAAEVGLG